MKKVLLLSILIFAIILSANSSIFFQLNFDGTPAEDQDPYVLGPGDVVTPETVISTTAFIGPIPGFTSHCLAPSIITPQYTSQGGNALGVLLRTDNHEGYFVDIGATYKTQSSLTIEILVKADEVCNQTRNEAGMMCFIENEAATGNVVWALRANGTYGTPQGEVQLMTSSGNLNTGAAPRTDYIEHWAVIMDRSANNKFMLYQNKSFVGEVSYTFAAKYFRLFSIGCYGNNAGSSRSLIGYIDAVCIDNTILAPDDFHLPGSVDVFDWVLY